MSSSIEQRLAALERLVAQRTNSNEALQPNYLSIDPTTGVVSANFSGRVYASGIILPTYIESDLSIPIDDCFVEWKDQTNSETVSGGIVSERVTTTQPPTSLLSMQALGENVGDEVSAQIQARTPNPNAYLTARVDATYNGTTGVSSAGVLVGGHNTDGSDGTEYTIADSNGHSNFAKIFYQVQILGINIPAQGNAENVVELPSPLPTSFQIECEMLQASGYYMDHITWCRISGNPGDTSVTLSFANWATTSASGDINVLILDLR